MNGSEFPMLADKIQKIVDEERSQLSVSFSKHWSWRWYLVGKINARLRGIDLPEMLLAELEDWL